MTEIEEVKFSNSDLYLYESIKVLYMGQVEELHDKIVKELEAEMRAKDLQICKLEDQIETLGDIIKECIQNLNKSQNNNFVYLYHDFDNRIKKSESIIFDLNDQLRKTIMEIDLQKSIIANFKSNSVYIFFEKIINYKIIKFLFSPIKKYNFKHNQDKNLKLIQQSELFDSAYYLKNNPEINDMGYNPALHYLLFGGYEGRNPSEKFDTLFYLNSNLDVKVNGLNPLIHYVLHGKNEGRVIKLI